jgi:hypothetical protein
MARVVDVVSVLLLFGAAAAFTVGVQQLSKEADLMALYWLIVGGLLLKSSSDLLRPRKGR